MLLWPTQVNDDTGDETTRAKAQRSACPRERAAPGPAECRGLGAHAGEHGLAGARHGARRRPLAMPGLGCLARGEHAVAHLVSRVFERSLAAALGRPLARASGRGSGRALFSTALAKLRVDATRNFLWPTARPIMTVRPEMLPGAIGGVDACYLNGYATASNIKVHFLGPRSTVW